MEFCLQINFSVPLEFVGPDRSGEGGGKFMSSPRIGRDLPGTWNLGATLQSFHDAIFLIIVVVARWPQP